MAGEKPHRTGRDNADAHGNVVMFPVDAAAYSDRAVKLLDRLQYDKALRYFRRAVECEPGDAIHQCNLAGALAETGRFEESNLILRHIVNELDPSMSECYYYMANNFAYLECFQEAEAALDIYLALDPQGAYRNEALEMKEMLHDEMNRPGSYAEAKPPANAAALEEAARGLKEAAAALSRGAEPEGSGELASLPGQAREARSGPEAEHQEARRMMEEGRFLEAGRVLERLLEDNPGDMPARNNLALAYYYMGFFKEAREMLHQVLALDPGHLHALCNLAIFERQAGRTEQERELMERMAKLQPFHREPAFKLANTLGILGRHEEAYRHLRRLLATGSPAEPGVYHCAAVAACHLGRYDEAAGWWAACRRLDPESGIGSYYLELLQRSAGGLPDPVPSYHYRVPYEAKARSGRRADRSAAAERNVRREAGDAVAAEEWERQLKSDPLVRSSLFWALRSGDSATKLQALQAMSLINDDEAKQALRGLLLDPEQDGYVKELTVYVLRLLGVEGALEVEWNGKKQLVDGYYLGGGLSAWEPGWQQVIDSIRTGMNGRYDMIRMHDAEKLWIEFLRRSYPNEVPRIAKADSWAAAIEYLIAKKHGHPITRSEAGERYAVSAATVAKHAKRIEEAFGAEATETNIYQ
ncbi:MAG: tetratricopeptide repeat protein [Paenibacillus dendritiformis]|uniref:tetratricopeptide repeat protein n=1 Tax=uncultured Paenibacillus sp. TaxID=227322 RepID=UPI0025E0A30B|nr:tetratricopeptide repeat protein [uncultured Paenibacillus sp.]MDU5143875.1 tetratricopeptide repeat protein [Paenibacillus dendritiformis]